MTFADQRRAYLRGQLGDDAAGSDPLGTLAAWIDQAREEGEIEATAMALATVDPDGAPVVRYVLCKGVTDRGVQFFTNTESRKGVALAADPRAAVTFWWPQVERTVRIVGTTELLPRSDVDAYFATRPPGSRISTFASDQSRPIAGRPELEARAAETAARFADAPPTTAPEAWGGYLLVARELELWQGRADRLHDRLHFTREGDRWQVARLQP